jgi:tetratricopeptide (TPR) repeat protein
MDQATQHLEKSLSFGKNNDYYAASTLASHYKSTSDYDKAIYYYEEALSRIENNNAENANIEMAIVSEQKIMSQYVETLIKAGRTALAGDVLSELEKKNPNNAFFKQLRAEISP